MKVIIGRRRIASAESSARRRRLGAIRLLEHDDG
jgi:hypothetical protein